MLRHTISPLLLGGQTDRWRAGELRDVATQDQYGVKNVRYWVDEKEGKVFCLVEAPDADTAVAVHREAHGLVADRIYEVEEGS